MPLRECLLRRGMRGTLGRTRAMRVGNEAWICAQQQPADHETSHNCHAEEKHNELKVGTFWIFAVIRRGRILVRIGFDFFAAHVCRMQAVRKKVWRPVS